MEALILFTVMFLAIWGIVEGCRILWYQYKGGSLSTIESTAEWGPTGVGKTYPASSLDWAWVSMEKCGVCGMPKWWDTWGSTCPDCATWAEVQVMEAERCQRYVVDVTPRQVAGYKDHVRLVKAAGW